MIKVLFLIHDLEHGGAEKVLVNLVNNMDKTRFDITVMTLFDVGVNRQFLSSDVTYKSCFSKMPRGNSHFMKLLTPRQLHKMFIKEKYDIEISYLEGPCARIISGCPNNDTKLVSWIHIEQKTRERGSGSFRSYKEAMNCYNRFDQIVCVSETVKKDFTSIFPVHVPVDVRYNTNESEKIIELAKEEVEVELFSDYEIKIVGVGKLLKNKGFDRIERIVNKLAKEGVPVHLYILGIGPEKDHLEQYAKEYGLEDKITLLGYQTNPYKYVSRCDLFVCASFAEGFSTAATEALILGVPVCTVEVAGMKEMLGENNEYGVVTENTEEALYREIKELVMNNDKRKRYKNKAKERGKMFRTEMTVHAVEEMLVSQYSEREKNNEKSY